MRVLSKRLYKLTRSSQHATDELAYVVEENALAHRMVRLHGAQNRQTQRFDVLGNSLRKLALKSTIAHASMTPLTQLLAAAALSAVITVALWQSSSSGVSVGNFVAFVTAMLMLITPIRHLAEIAGPITRGLVALERGLELIDNTPEQSSGTHSVARVQGAIALQDVWVRYKEGQHRTMPTIWAHRPAWHQPGDCSGRGAGLCRPIRFGQDHPGQPVAPLCGG
jgi:subfamily B ATP-binding cassette protein MsbA